MEFQQPEPSPIEKLDGLNTITFHLLKNCNLRCIMCPHPHMPTKLMSPRTVYKALDALVRPIHISFIGGEPCLWLNRYPDVLPRTLAEGHAVRLFSNGLLFHKIPGLIDAFRDQKISAQISIDGYGETYERVRKRASWETLVSNIRAIQTRRKESNNKNSIIAVTYLLMRSTLPDLPRFVEFCVAEGIDYIRLSYTVVYDIMVRMGEISEEESVIHYPNETNDIVSRAKEIARREGISLFAPDPIGQVGGSGGEWIGRARFIPLESRSILPKNPVPVCHRPFTEIHIVEDGTILPCCCGTNHAPILGHVEDSLKAVWSGEIIQDIRNQMVAGTFPESCRCSANVITAKRQNREEHYIPRLGNTVSSNTK